MRRWASDQRAEHRLLKAGKPSSMSEEKIERLASIGFDLEAEDAAADRAAERRQGGRPRTYKPRKEWTDMFNRLVEYREATGSTRIDRRDKENAELRIWLNEQNMAYRHIREGRAKPGTTLTAEKRKMLEDAGHEFVHYTFDERLEQLRRYKAECGGSVAVPIDHPELGKWAAKMREKYRKFQDGRKVAGITQAEVNQLTALGFQNTKRRMVSSEADNAHWEAMFKELRAYKEREGHCNVPTTPPHSDLVKWVIAQRREYKKLKDDRDSLLTARRVMQLNDVGFQFIQRGNYMTWADRVQMLRDFKEKNGNLKIPVSHPDLGWFVSSQREEWRKRQEGHSTSLTDERYTDLNELGFVWVAGKRKGPVTQPRKSWEERYQELLAFRQEYGHACVPQHYPGLGYWVHAQRNAYRALKKGKKSSMTHEKANRLNECGFVWDAMKRKSVEGGQGGGASASAPAVNSSVGYYQDDDESVGV